MLFRIWFYACKVGLLGFGLVLLGASTAYPWSAVAKSIGIVIVVPLCIAGALLGIWGIFGIRSSCPLCGKRGLWVRYEEKGLGLACDGCGIVGGNPLWNWKLRVSEASHQKNTTERASRGESESVRPAEFFVSFFVVAAGISMASVGTQTVKALGFVLIGLVVVCWAYLFSRAGVTHTKWGTVRRDERPVRFYCGLLLTLISGVILVVVGIVTWMQ